MNRWNPEDCQTPQKGECFWIFAPTKTLRRLRLLAEMSEGAECVECGLTLVPNALRVWHSATDLCCLNPAARHSCRTATGGGQADWARKRERGSVLLHEMPLYTGKKATPKMRRKMKTFLAWNKFKKGQISRNKTFYLNYEIKEILKLDLITHSEQYFY